MSAPIIARGLTVRMPKSKRVLTVTSVCSDGSCLVLGYELGPDGVPTRPTIFGPGCFEKRIKGAEILTYAHEAYQDSGDIV